MDKLKGLKKNVKEIAIVTLAVLIAGIVILATKLVSRNNAEMLSKEITRSMTYNEVQPGEDAVKEKNTENVIENVKFDAFFLRDLDGDGYAESIRGACREIGGQDTLYMELKVQSGGELKNAKIQIQGKNFYLQTNLPKDQQLKANYISANTQTIAFNTLSSGTQRLFSGKVRSGDYSTSNKYGALANNTANYSRNDNKVIFTGTYVSESGTETAIQKEIPLTVDWHGTAKAAISTTNISKSISNFSSLYDETNLNISFTVQTSETANILLLKDNVLTGKVPALNGYMPTNVTISGTNVTFTYNQATGEFTATREAKVNASNVITTNAYTSQSGNTRYGSYNFTVKYPKEAYESESNQSVTLNIPMQTYYEGYNNTNEEFANPYKSNTASSTVVVTLYQYVAPTVPATPYTPPVYSTSIDVKMGNYVGGPYYKYYVSKEKPERIYNEVSEQEIGDRYIVSWYAYAGTNTNYTGLVLKENVNESTSTIDTFIKADSTEESMDGIVSNVGIYFSNAASLLGSEGWIKVYNDETNDLLVTFNSSNWNSYSASNPYMYASPVKHVRVETSKTNNEANMTIYNIKELNDEAITTKYDREQFATLKQIKTNLKVYLGENGTPLTDTATAYYEQPYSVATFAISKDQISTQEVCENEVLTIKTTASNFMEQKWKNATFLIKMPADIMEMVVNSVTISDNTVTISDTNLYEENGNYYLRIETENLTPTTYTITVNANITPNPRMATATKPIEMYAKNGDGVQYTYGAQDTCDVDTNGNVTEYVHKSTVNLALIAPNSLLTHQTATNYDNKSSVIVAPQIAKVEKSQRTANVEITITNNYTDKIKNIVIQGVVPYTGNKGVIGNSNLGSNFSANMGGSGVTVPAELASYATVYYSTLERPTKDVTDTTNGWVTAENVSNWAQIKSFLIDLSTYELNLATSHTFSYQINLPAGVNYNDITYSSHAVYFDLITEMGLYSTSTEASKLGFMIVRQYDLILENYQTNTSKKLAGTTFKVTEIGNENNTFKKSTDENGTLTISDLYVERRYKLQQTHISDDYAINNEEIEFYTYVDANDNLGVAYYNTSTSTTQDLTEKYSWVKSATATKEAQDDYKTTIALNNVVKARIQVVKTYTNKDESTGNLKGAKFSLTGQGKNTVLTTNSSGIALTSGMYLDQTYTLTETKAKGYYLNAPITVTITDTGSGFTETVTGTTKAHSVTTTDEIPTVIIELDDEEVPKYNLKVTTYAEGKASVKLAGAQYRLTGDGLTEDGIILTSDSNGEVNIDGLYEYVEEAGVAKGGYTGQYTITQIYAPEGYVVDGAAVTFKATRSEGNLVAQAISGGNTISSLDPMTVLDADTTSPTVKFGFTNPPIFSLTKYDEDGNTLPGVKFVMYEVNGSAVVTGFAKDTSGEYAGEYDEANDRYVLTTNEEGKIPLDLPKGYYKVVEVEAPEGYVFDENEKNRTQYFGIDQSKAAVLEFSVASKTAIKGEGFNTINSTYATTDGGYIAVGSLYGSTNIAGTTYTSQGRKDGLIIKYAENNSIEWLKGIGGTLGEEFKKVIQTQDGGYAVVGYFESETMNVGEEGTITNSGARDAILIKLGSSGNYEWSAVIGGTLEDYAYSVCEDENNNLLVSGGYFSTTLSFKGTDGVAATKLTNLGDMDGYVVSFDKDGKFKWAQNLGSTNATSGVQAVDVSYINEKYVVAANYWGTLYVDSAKTASIANAGNQDSALVYYNLDGTYNKYIRVSGAGYDDIRGVTIDPEGYTVVYGNRTNTTTTLTGTNGAATTVAMPTNKVNTTSVGTTYLSSYIYRLNSNGQYDASKSITFGNSAGNDEIMEVVATEDGGLLMGGFTYSSTLDIDGGGNDIINTGDTNTSFSRGFIAKLDENNKVVKALRQYNQGTYQETRSVAQVKDGGYVAGGVVDGTTLNLDITGQNLTGFDAYSEDGYVVKYGVREVSPAMPAKAELEYTNNLQRFTVSVSQYSEENGEEEGDRLYDTGATVVGNYTEEFPESGHKKYVETVRYGENGERSILIVPDTDYSIVGITVNGEDFDYTVSQSDGSVTIPAFENVTENKIVIVKVNKSMAEVKINHYLWTEQDGTTTTKVADTNSIFGKIGSDYQTLPKQDINYDIATNEDIYAGYTESEALAALNKTTWEQAGYESFEDFKADFYIPGNASGTYSAGGTQVNFYYKEIKYTLTVKHLLSGTEEQVPSKTSGTVEDEVTGKLSLNAAYTANKSENVDYNMYEVEDVGTSDASAVVNEETQQVTGTISENTTITYYYQVKDAGAITVHHYITGTTDRVPSNTGAVVEDEIITTVTDQGDTRTAKIGDTYTSAATSSLAQNYVLDQAPASATVTFTLEPQEVIYYYKMVTPTLSNTITTTVNKETMADSDADQALTYTITYNATVQNYIGQVSTNITDTLPFKIDTTKNYSLDGGTYNENTKTITWSQIHDVDTYANPSSGTISITKTIKLTYKDIPVTTGTISNTVQGTVSAIAANTTSEATSQTAQTTYTHFRSLTVSSTWDDGVETPPASIKVNLIGTVTNPDSSTLRVNLTAIDPSIVTQATLNNSAGSENGANWTYNWAQLPKYDAVGRQIVYTVEVDPAIDYNKYTPEVTGNMDNGYTITIYNTYGGATERQTGVQYYDTNDGTTDVNFEARENGFTRRGYTFENWRLESPTGTDYNPHDTVTVNPEVDSDKTTYNMYAIWGQQ